jgi:hypothetical protein
MAATTQSQAVAAANTLLAIAVELANIQAAITQATTQYTQLAMGSTLAAMATAASNADGSLGTADPSPVSGHVIDTRVLPNLSRAVSATDLGTLVTLVSAVATLLNGTAPATQGEAPQLLAKLVGG